MFQCPSVAENEMKLFNVLRLLLFLVFSWETQEVCFSKLLNVVLKEGPVFWGILSFFWSAL